MNEVDKARRTHLFVAARQLDLVLDDATIDQLLAYLDLLQRWNRTYNLTAVRDPAEMLTQHLFDCLAVIGPLRRFAPAGRLLDVGSGGGLPGIVISLACPGWDVTCVDTVGKKAAFIQQAAVELRLPNLHSQHSRVEALTLPAFDLIASRAFASLPDFVKLTRMHLKANGVWMAMKGRRPDDELVDLPPEVEMFHVEQLTVPDLAAERCIIWMRLQPPRPEES
ncbi:MAG: 16S rRNA (guanine(527)-N(7))-methyltransferase RsmG [Burkholderiales bacterium]|jgi:16S rRNA (guanine527-N7)-methyltransferase|nr:16S rRNA (guanine(527)-N(7))-methyltransferase RsmG [Burkholderiales bacterium]